MTESFLVELLKQGGFALLSGFIFWMYRKDAAVWAVKQTETAAAFMAFGERTAAALTLVSETMRQQSTVLERVEARLHESQICPISNITTEMFRSSIESPGRRKSDAAIEKMVERAENARRRRPDDPPNVSASA